MKKTTRYLKKQIPVEAVQFFDTVQSINALSEFINNQDVKINYEEVEKPQLVLWTSHGLVRICVGDYVLKDANGDFYPCSKDVFEKTYEVYKECQTCVWSKRNENLDEEGNCLLDCKLGKFFNVEWDRYEQDFSVTPIAG